MDDFYAAYCPTPTEAIVMPGHDLPGPQSKGTLVKQAVIVLSVAVGFTIGLAIIWIASTAVFTILVGMLLAVVFDAGARGLGWLVSWDRRIRLLVVFIMTAILIAAVTWWGGSTLLNQTSQLVGAMHTVPSKVDGVLSSLHIQWRPDVSQMLPSMETVFGGATALATKLLDLIVIVAAVIFLGAFFAWEPQTYKAAILSVLPKSKRERVSEVLDLAADSTREWLLGQSVAMAVIFAFSLGALLLIGMPYPAILALQAGVLVFIPTLGPVLAGMVIVLAGFSQSTTMALYGLAVYVGIQFLETHLVTPLVQERTVRLPPAATLGIQLIAGLLFGLVGVAFSIPLSAAAKVLIEELYVKDYLGGPWQPPAGPKAHE